MKLKIFILLSVCLVARAQPAPPAPTSAPRRPSRAISLATNAAAVTATGSTTTTNSVKIATPVPGSIPPSPDAATQPAEANPDKPILISPKAPAPAPAPAAPQEELFTEATISFQAMDIEQVLPFYSKLVNRTILRGTALPAGKISLVAQTPLTKSEAIAALDAVLGMNGIAMVNIGEKFVKAVPAGNANQAGAPLNRGNATNLAELGGYMTHVEQLKYTKPSEIVPLLQPFASTIGASAIFAIDSSQILVLRDYTENVKRMLELIKEIDVSVPSEFVSEVIPIKYALAEEISAALNGLSSGGGSGGTTIGKNTSRLPAANSGTITQPGTTTYPGGGNQPRTVNPGGTTGTTGTPGGTASFSDRLSQIIKRAAVGGAGDFQILGQTKIIADSRTNSLLIFASRQDMEMIKDIIAKLDVVLAQVLIEAIIMEVSLDDSRTVGFSYVQGKDPTKIGSFLGAGGLKNTPFLTPGSFSQTGSAAGSTNGTTAANGLPGGFSYAGRFGGDLDVTVQALATDSRVNVLSRPRIQTSHAVPASLFIGNTVPYITGTSFNDFGGTGARSQYQEKRIGITLDVLPLINSEGLVVMDIQQNIQQLGVDKIIDGNPVPTTTERTASAKVAVRDRDTIILGGFISSSKSKSKSGIPLLKDIPLLGYLFRSTSDGNQRVELIVLIRPTVLPTPEAAALQATVERNKLPGVHQAELENNKEEAKRLKKFNDSHKKDKESDAKNDEDNHQFQPVEGVK